MTISTTASSVTFTGNGTTTVWPFAFLIPEAGNLVVTLLDIATLTPTTLDPATYTVTGLGDSAGGSVTYPISGSPLTSATRITISRNVPYTQLTDIQNQSTFLADVIEKALDVLTMETQQLAQGLAQAVSVPLGSDPVSVPDLFAAVANAQTAATEAAASETAAAVSETNASTAATNAAAAETAATTSETNASASASAASTNATNAAASATSASTNASTASTAATTATTQATAAANSATNAANSATSAAASAAAASAGGAASAFRPETALVLKAMSDAGAAVSSPLKDAIDKLVDTFIRIGLWSAQDALYIPSLAPTSAAALINWKNPGTYDLVNHGTTFVVGKGFKGDGTAAYLEAPIYLDTAGLKFSSGSSQAFAFITDSPSPTTGSDSSFTVVATSSAADLYIMPYRVSGVFDAGICNGMQMTAPATSRLGFRLVRGANAGGGSGEFVLSIDGQVSYDQTVSGATAYDHTTVCLLGRAAGGWSPDTLGVFGIGQATTSVIYAEIDAALREALSAVGGLVQGALTEGPQVSTLADVSKTIVPATAQSILVLGNSAIGDRRPFPMLRQASNPGTASAEQSADGAWFDEPPPTEFERVDLEYFLRRSTTRVAGLLAALQALFQETNDQTRIKLVLDGQGIPITVASPFRLRSNKWSSGGNVTFGGQQSTGHTAGRSLRNLHLVVPAGATFSDGDDVFALEGMCDGAGGTGTDAGTDSLYDFDVHDIIVDLQPYIAGGGSAKVNCFAMTGTHFVSVYRSKFPAVPSGAYGFYERAFDRLQTSTKIVNTGLLIEDQNSTGNGDTTEHIHVEGSDVNVVKGHFGGRGIMIHTTYGQLSTFKCHHAATPPTGDRALSILADNPGDIHCVADELDGGRILITNNPVNTAVNGSSPDFGAICVEGTEFNEAGVDCVAGQGFLTLSNMRLTTDPTYGSAATKLTRFSYKPAWMPSGTSAPQLVVNAKGSGTTGWNTSGSHTLNFHPTSGPNAAFSGQTGFTVTPAWAGS